MHASRTFEPHSHQVIEARRFAREVLESEGRPPGDVPLIVSELATNAVLHARSDFTVGIDSDAERVRVEVFDGNARLPSFSSVPPDAYSGRGLLLVQTLAASWGVDAHPGDGKTIWFEVTASEPPKPLRAGAG